MIVNRQHNKRTKPFSSVSKQHPIRNSSLSHSRHSKNHTPNNGKTCRIRAILI